VEWTECSSTRQLTCRLVHAQARRSRGSFWMRIRHWLVLILIGCCACAGASCNGLVCDQAKESCYQSSPPPPKGTSMSASRKLKSATILAAAGAAATAGVTAAAEAAVAAPPVHRGHDALSVSGPVWKNKKTGRYLTVLNGSTANGAEIVTNSTDTQAQQRWSNLLHSTGLWSFRNHNSAKCMVEQGTFTNPVIDQHSCNISGRFFGLQPVESKNGAFIGSSFLPGGGTVSVQGHLCENTTTHRVFDQVSFPAFPYNIPKNCLWSTF
jgi:hypothetical protein